MAKPYTRKFDVCTPVENSGYKTTWLKCGIAFENAKSGKITIKLSTVPVGTDDEGKLVLVLFDSEKEEYETVK